MSRTRSACWSTAHVLMSERQREGDGTLVGESGRWVLLLTPSDTSSCSVIYVCHIVCCMTHAGRCRHTRPAGGSRQDEKKASETKQDWSRLNWKRHKYSLSHIVFSWKKRQDGNDKCQEMGEKNPAITFGRMQQLRGFCGKAGFSSMEKSCSQELASFFFLPFFCFSLSHLEFTMHSFRRGNKTEYCCEHVNVWQR